MLAAYLVSLIVGGVFVGLSVLSGVGKDADGGLDKDFDGDHALDGGHAFDHDHDFDHELDVDAAADVDVSGDLDVDVDVDFGDAHGTSLAEAGLAGDGEGDKKADSRRARKKRKRLWLPFMSFRFWTFGACFFGLTGTLLTALALTVEPTTLAIALGLGVTTGTVTSSLVHSLRKPVGADIIQRAEYVGQVGELLYPLAVGGTSQMALAVRHRRRDMLVVSEATDTLPKGTRVVILRVDDAGRAHVVAEQSMFEGRALAPPQPSLVEETVEDVVEEDS